MRRRNPADLTVVPDLDRELDDLYGLSPDEFVAARNDLAKRLKKSGREQDAERVSALRKPSVSAWAINQLARRETDAVRELTAAGTELVEAQKQALGGKGTAEFNEASRRQRDAVRALVPAAVKLLADVGHQASAAVQERIASSLRAASVDPDARSLLEQGRLETDVEPSGLGLLAGFVPAGAEVSRRPRKEAPSPGQLRQARKVLDDARKAERRVSKQAADAQRTAERARAAADEAAERAAALAGEAEAAAEAVERAKNELEELEAARRGS